MGVLYDYFRAADAATVVRLMDEHAGDSPDGKVDTVGAKGIEPSASLGQLVGFLVDEPSTTRLISGSLVWPAGGEDHEGPWVVDLGDPARDALAGIDAARIPELAQRWSGIEEFGGYAEPAWLAAAITDLSGLARRARDSGEHLYCWMSL